MRGSLTRTATSSPSRWRSQRSRERECRRPPKSRNAQRSDGDHRPAFVGCGLARRERSRPEANRCRSAQPIAQAFFHGSAKRGPNPLAGRGLSRHSRRQGSPRGRRYSSSARRTSSAPHSQIIHTWAGSTPAFSSPQPRCSCRKASRAASSSGILAGLLGGGERYAWHRRQGRAGSGSLGGYCVQAGG